MTILLSSTEIYISYLYNVSYFFIIIFLLIVKHFYICLSKQNVIVFKIKDGAA